MLELLAEARDLVWPLVRVRLGARHRLCRALEAEALVGVREAAEGGLGHGGAGEGEGEEGDVEHEEGREEADEDVRLEAEAGDVVGGEALVDPWGRGARGREERVVLAGVTLTGAREGDVLCAGDVEGAEEGEHGVVEGRGRAGHVFLSGRPDEIQGVRTRQPLDFLEINRAVATRRDGGRIAIAEPQVRAYAPDTDLTNGASPGGPPLRYIAFHAPRVNLRSGVRLCGERRVTPTEGMLGRQTYNVR